MTTRPSAPAPARCWRPTATTSSARPPTGARGIEAAAALQPEVVLLDVRLPDMDGFEVAGALVANGSEAAVVITSSSDDPLYPARAIGSGARGFVAKHDVSGPTLDRLLAASPD